MNTALLFNETQYLGRNMYGLARRMVIALFCLIAHFITDERDDTAGLFFIVGSATLLLSLILLFVPYYTIKLDQEYLTLKSTGRKEVKIPLRVITNMEITSYNRYHLNNPVFNVLDIAEYKFYAEGRKALVVNLEGGNVFRIGCRDAALLKEKIEARKTIN